jgi:hypothetical protein
MIQLPDVTLVTIDTKAHDLTRMAVENTLRQIEPAETLIFTDDEFPFEGMPVRKIDPLHSMNDYNSMLWAFTPFFVRTSHMLVIQWDGWVLDGSAWSDEWLQYDYIGAPWHWHTGPLKVGNGGFSLRSMSLMRHVQDHNMPAGSQEDVELCIKLRPELENAFKWAPIEVAQQFSYEHGRPDHTTFGFHDVRNWRNHLTAEQLDERFAAAPPYVLDKQETQDAIALVARERRLRQTLREIFPD